MRILGVIPARGGSKGIPKKNLAIVGGKPLIQYTIEAARSSNRLTDFVVSTDNLAIMQLSKELGAAVPFRRPSILATDDAHSYPVLMHSLHFMEESRGELYDAAMLLQPTTPFRTANDIDASIEMLETSEADSVVSVVHVGANHPARMKVIEDGLLMNFDHSPGEDMRPRQELSDVYLRNGAIYMSRRTSLVTSGSLVGYQVLPFIMSAQRSINIDSDLDLLLAEALLMRSLP